MENRHTRRQKDRQAESTDIHAGRKTGRQTEQIYTQTERQAGRENRHTRRQKDRQAERTYTQVEDRQAERTDIRTDRKTGRQAGRKTGRQAERQAGKELSLIHISEPTRQS